MKFRISGSHCALLVLDLQQLFTSASGPFQNHQAGALIEQVNDFTGFAHGIGLPVIYSRYVLADDLSDAGLLSENEIVQQGHFCESAALSQLDERLIVPEQAIHLQRNRPGAFWNGSLKAALAENRADTVLLCGLSINNAISTTAREAFAHDIAAVVVRECCGAAPFEKDPETYFEILHTWTAEVAGVKNIRQRLQNPD